MTGISVTGIARDRATVHGVVNPDFGITYYTFEYGTNGVVNNQIARKRFSSKPDDTDRPLTFSLPGCHLGPPTRGGSWR